MKDDLRSAKPAFARLAGDTPSMRLFALLELICDQDRFVTLHGLVEETGLPKPTVHRMLQQLEAARLLQREENGRSYGVGARLRRFAENMLRNDTTNSARRAVLRQLTEEVGETCNLTVLSGSEVLYLDRVETAAPLRISLHPGSRVPAWCSASGKLFLAQLSPAQRRRLLGSLTLTQYTPKTRTSLREIEEEIDLVRSAGYAIDDEEFIEGLMCVAVLVPRTDGGRANLAVAIQAPIARARADDAPRFLPALERAATALAQIADQADEARE